ncbi:TIGR04255 family protein [Aquincola sp. S2]|uniref:TIGR04255 family protein n=1 Tax=Pseudaquabacterium terrae TaxID=2732868 RepID=A0ABX2EKN9_9BURK|nr:TIGR04255 family protein [Aquabacterium terrae]NRF69200.1 TIGR04255 family protein [Aquabacterium terrae]
MGAPLKNPPVYLTMAQVRFNAVLKLANYLPDIQEALRKAGYPVYQAHKAVVLQIAVQDGQPTPMPTLRERYSFGNLDKTHTFWLDNEAFALQSTHYGHFESFSEVFMTGMSRVHEAVQLDYTDRIGLRYLDRVFPRKGDTLDKYLFPEAMGLGNRLGGTTLQSYAETLSDAGLYKLRSRVVIQSGGLVFPPDVVLGDMVVVPRLAEYEGLHAILDNDGFFERREVYSVKGVAKHLDAIHQVIGDAFRATATPHAFVVWNE